MSDAYPSLLDKLVVDNKTQNFKENWKDNQAVKTTLCAFGCLVAAVLLFVIPRVCGYYNLSLIIAGALLLLTAVIVLLSPYLYTYHLVNGFIICAVFIIIGYGIPLFAILADGISFLTFIASNSGLLLCTFFGNIGLCLYLYCVWLVISKIAYVIKNK